MARTPRPDASGSGLSASHPQRRGRWWLAAGAAGLLVAEAVAKSRSRVPLALSLLDALAFLTLAVLLGTYAILARAGREQASSEAEGQGSSAGELHP